MVNVVQQHVSGSGFALGLNRLRRTSATRETLTELRPPFSLGETMECFYCGQPASGVYTWCHKAYCREHGDGTRFCYRCRIDHDSFYRAVGIGLGATALLTLSSCVILTIAGDFVAGLIFSSSPIPIIVSIIAVVVIKYRNSKRKQLIAE